MAIPRIPRLNNAVNKGAADTILARGVPIQNYRAPTRPGARPSNPFTLPRRAPIYRPPRVRDQASQPFPKPSRRDQIYAPGTDPTAHDPVVVGKSATLVLIKRKKRRRNCCNPYSFRHHWLRKGNSIRNKINPNIHFSHEDFNIGITGKKVMFQRGFSYQYHVTKDYLEYQPKGTTLWADGQYSPNCALVEAKYVVPNSKKYNTPANSEQPFDKSIDLPIAPGLSQRQKGRVNNQFHNYGLACNFPAPPAEQCWNISLRTYVSQPGPPVYFFAQLMINHNIEGSAQYYAAPNE